MDIDHAEEAPSVAVNVAHPLLQVILAELQNDKL